MVSNTSRKDYFVANALEMTPHPNQRLVSVLEQPIMNRKYKYTILETTLTAASATSTTPISLIALNQGVTDITRVGDRIRLKRIWFTGKIYGSASATGPISARLVIVCWNPLGAAASNAPVASQVLQGSAGYLPYAAYSKDFGDSYQVVYDVLVSVNPFVLEAEAEMVHLDRALSIDAQFNASGTVPVTNNLYLFLVDDAGFNHPAVNFQCTLWFDDEDA
jgi:hypothetical protein